MLRKVMEVKVGKATTALIQTNVGWIMENLGREIDDVRDSMDSISSSAPASTPAPKAAGRASGQARASNRVQFDRGDGRQAQVGRAQPTNRPGAAWNRTPIQPTRQPPIQPTQPAAEDVPSLDDEGELDADIEDFLTQ